MAELKALSKLKMAGKLHYWRGTIEIGEYELHAICDEIQAEHDMAIAAVNSAAGKWAKADAQAMAHEGTRWHELFGTPERAARTMAGIVCDDGGCEGCTLHGADCSYDKNAMLEWLRGDAE